jgi:hypothetical protein
MTRCLPSSAQANLSLVFNKVVQSLFKKDQAKSQSGKTKNAEVASLQVHPSCILIN